MEYIYIFSSSVCTDTYVPIMCLDMVGGAEGDPEDKCGQLDKYGIYMYICMYVPLPKDRYHALVSYLRMYMCN